MRRRLGGVDSLAARVRRDCVEIEGALAPIARHRMWGDVGRMRLFPASSTTLQRRGAYREVLRHYVLLRMASTALPLDAAEVQQLLEVKDIARLYELWTAFAVVEAVSAWKGVASGARRLAHGDLGATLGSGLLVSWGDGTEVAYNASYTTKPGFHGQSWSLRLRPDVVLFVPDGPSAGLHVLDAKFRLSGTLAGAADDVEGDARVDDLHKMHTYRDAIPAVRSAWVMYPGTFFRFWARNGSIGDTMGSGPVDGIGAVPVVPGVEAVALRGLVGAIMGRADADAMDAVA
ncbi:MAG: hypothetical protein H0V89_09380 [Deltaproteobacteria bacterium]|nr:hypothetical protein [Deltaproteobacteria bacterium]